jgi:hypothetical protein
MLLPEEKLLLIGLRSLAVDVAICAAARGVLEIRNGEDAGVWRFRDGIYNFTPTGIATPTIRTPDFWAALEIGTGRDLFTLRHFAKRTERRRRLGCKR